MNGQTGALTRLYGWQALLILAASGAYFALKGPDHAVAALSGGLIATANASVLFAFLRRAERTAGHDVEHNVRLFYVSALARFITVLALFALTIGALQLEPLALLIGFIAGQAALVIHKL